MKINVRTYVCTHVSMHVLYVRMHVCMYICTHVCTYVFTLYLLYSMYLRTYFYVRTCMYVHIQCVTCSYTVWHIYKFEICSVSIKFVYFVYLLVCLFVC